MVQNNDKEKGMSKTSLGNMYKTSYLWICKNFKGYYQDLKLLLKTHYKTLIKATFICGLLLSFSFMLHKNIEYKESATKHVNTIIEKWGQKDFKWLGETFNTDPENFQINTGFEQDIINKTFEQIVYDKNAAEVSQVSLEKGTNGEINARVRVVVETYDTMAIMKQFLQNMVNDKTQITYQYTQESFLEKHAKQLQEDLEGFKRNYMDVQDLLMTYNNKTGEWEMVSVGDEGSFDYEFFNSISGNMFEYMNQVKKAKNK